MTASLCGSFCTLEASLVQMKTLHERGIELLPIMSFNTYETNTRFFGAAELREKVKTICGREIIHTIPDAEPLGPRIRLDALIICPCTGNTLAKLACGITDTRSPWRKGTSAL